VNRASAEEWTGAVVYFEPGRAGSHGITVYCSDLRHLAAGAYYAHPAAGTLTVICAGALVQVPLCACCVGMQVRVSPCACRAETQVPDEG
jgi:hypothetical protein